MKIVIQCAKDKEPSAKTLKTKDGWDVDFVAHTELAPPPKEGAIYAHPDDSTGDGRSWRQRLIDYNSGSAATNPLDLSPAYRLYRPSAYTLLVKRFGGSQVYILSAGWGLIRSDFLVPKYDITFSFQAENYQRRRKKDPFHDFCHLDNGSEPIIFFGGKDYLSLFVKLTADYVGPRIIVYNSSVQPRVQGAQLIRYPTEARTNWHYQAAHDFADGSFVPF